MAIYSGNPTEPIGESGASAPFISLPAGPAAVYSVRLAVSGYAGKCMNVRRSSDNTTADIGFIGNDMDIAGALAFANGSTLYVTKWYDQSGNGLDVSQTQGPAHIAQQPQVIFSLNGGGGGHRPGVCFGGLYSGNNYSILKAASLLSLIADQSVFAVVDNYSSYLNYICGAFDGTTPFNGWMLSVGNAAGTSRSTSYWSSTKAAFINDTNNTFAKQCKRIGITRTAGSVQFYNDGIASGAAVTGGGNSASVVNFALGGNNTAVPSGLLGACIYEVAIYASALSGANITSLDNGQANYFIQNPTASPAGTAGVAFGVSSITVADTITIGSHLTFERTQPWTAFAAIQAKAVPTLAGMIFTNATTGPGFPGYEVWIDGDGLVHVRIISNVVTPNYLGVIGSQNICDGKVHMIAVSYDGSSTPAGVKIYVDGVQDTNTTTESNTLSATIVSGTQTFMVGNQANHLDFAFRGEIGFFSLDNVVRSAAYIAAVTPTALPTNDGANTSLYLTLNDDAGTTAVDSSANAFNGTLTSASMWYPS